MSFLTKSGIGAVSVPAVWPVSLPWDQSPCSEFSCLPRGQNSCWEAGVPPSSSLLTASSLLRVCRWRAPSHHTALEFLSVLPHSCHLGVLFSLSRVQTEYTATAHHKTPGSHEDSAFGPAVESGELAEATAIKKQIRPRQVLQELQCWPEPRLKPGANPKSETNSHTQPAPWPQNP